MSLERFFLESPLDDAAGIVELSGDEARHLAKVLRKREGDEVTVFDGRGAEAGARVLEMKRDSVRLEVLERRGGRSIPMVEITACIGLPRSGAADDVMRRAIEAGAARIVPLVCQRSVHRADRRPDGKREARFRKLAVTAMKQCGRNLMPELSPPVSVSELLRGEGEDAVFGSIAGGAESLRGLESTLGGFSRRVRFVVGPEGGFTLEEEADLQARGFHPVGLGPQILRVETAVTLLTGFFAILGEGELR